MAFGAIWGSCCWRVCLTDALDLGMLLGLVEDFVNYVVKGRTRAKVRMIRLTIYADSGNTKSSNQYQSY